MFMKYTSYVLLCSIYYTAEGWSHAHQDHWDHVSRTCTSGKSQSPIDVISERSYYDATLGPVHFKQGKLTTKNSAYNTMTLANNGHTLQVDFRSDISLEGAGLSNRFKVAQLHFHWGITNSNGSEHSIDGQHYALEMHIVCYDADKFMSLMDAVTSPLSSSPPSVAVVAVLFKVSNRRNKNIDYITRNMPSVIDTDTSVIIKKQFRINRLLPRGHSRYFRYDGSLTTPGCNEVVLWTIMEGIGRVSQAQMNAFRAARTHSGDTISGNFRDIQSLNQRLLKRSFL